jgi:glycosyltransferase involved in cell wall biosynthesis
LSSKSTSCELSVVIPALNEGHYLRDTVEALARTVPPSSEIIVVDDGSTDGCADGLEAPGRSVLRISRCGSARARNRGAAAATGRIVVFADAHMDLPFGWYEPLARALDAPDVGAIGPCIEVMGRPECRGFGLRWTGAALEVEWLPPAGDTPYEVPLLGGCFMAMRRADFTAIGGFDDGIIRWGSEDSEISLRIWLLGQRLLVHPGVVVGHLFRSRHPYEIDHVEIVHNMLRVALLHFSRARLNRVLERLKQFAGFAPALSRAAETDVLQRRAALARLRARSDDWFFAHFDEIN